MRIKAHENSGGVEIIVSDNVIGIHYPIREKVFEMFYRGSDTSEGSGLGLYIVKNALKKLNGNICLSGKEEEGTEFVITLPKFY